MLTCAVAAACQRRLRDLPPSCLLPPVSQQQLCQGVKMERRLKAEVEELVALLLSPTPSNVDPATWPMVQGDGRCHSTTASDGCRFLTLACEGGRPQAHGWSTGGLFLNLDWLRNRQKYLPQILEEMFSSQGELAHQEFSA